MCRRWTRRLAVAAMRAHDVPVRARHATSRRLLRPRPRRAYHSRWVRPVIAGGAVLTSVGLLLSAFFLAGPRALALRDKPMGVAVAAPSFGDPVTLPTAMNLAGGEISAQPSASPTSRAVSMPTSTVLPQTRLVIGTIGINALLVPSVIADGEFVLPTPTTVAELAQGPGRWLLAGHVSWEGTPAVFARLSEVKPGTVITLQRGRDRTLYRVATIEKHERGRLPPDVFASAGSPRIVLITCTGPRVDQRLPDGRVVFEHRDNLVVTAVPL